MRLLVVEDEAELAAQIAETLRQQGFVVDVLDNGEEAAFRGAVETYDLAVLDLGLPGRDGISVLRHWRTQGAALPVLILTARDAWADKRDGFNAGADDYLTKPFRLDELILRVRALIRRAAGHAHPEIQVGALSLDSHSRQVTLDGAPLRLTAFEAQVLEYLIHHCDRVVSRSELSEHVYSYDSDRDFNSLEVIISRLRRKVGQGRIETLRGQGYRLLAR